MGDKPVTVRLPAELIEKVDVAAAVEGGDRTAIVTEALQEYLADLANDDDFRGRVLDLYLDGEVSADMLETIVGRPDAESIQASEALLDDGVERSDDLAGLADDRG